MTRLTAPPEAMMGQMKPHCCDMMARIIGQRCPDHPNPFDCPDSVVGRFSDGRYGLIIHDGGQSMIVIQFCPWCGNSLAKGKPARRKPLGKVKGQRAP